MKPRTRRFFGTPLASLVFAGGSVALLALTLPACGLETSGVFESPSGGTNTGGSGGRGGEGGGGQGGSTSSSGQGGSTSSSGQGGAASSSGQGGATSSSGMGGMGGGQAGSGGQTTSSSSGGPVDPENCLDGIDNDKDGSADCADSDCTEGFTCTDAPPDGWSTVAFERGPGAPPVAMPCDSGAMPEELFVGPAGPAECAACSCGALTGTTCNAPGLACFPGSAGCNFGQQNWTNNFQNGNCAKPDIGASIQLSCRLTSMTSVAEPGSCMPSVSDFPNKETWLGWAQACAIKTSGGGCATGSVCAPKPAGTQSLCIRQDGKNACPANWQQVDTYASATDDRACADCSCAPSATCTGGFYRVFDLDACAAGGSDPPIDVDSNTCRNVSALLDAQINSSWSVQRNLPTPSGNCAAQGGEATGSVQPQGQVTFCCK